MPSDRPSLPRDTRRLSQVEFVTLMAFTYATVAFSIDAMLPALPQIAATLSPGDANRAQLVLTSFMVGMGCGTLFTGALSDAFGRKPTIIAGLALYIVGALLALTAQSLEMLLLARVIQGFGASAPRISVLALVRDLYAGREMARIMSFVNMLFILVPAVAPAIGQGIIALAGWRAIFAVFILFALTAGAWITTRQPETLLPGRRRPLSLSRIAEAAREAAGNRDVVICTLTIALGFAQMFGLLSSSQQLYAQTYGRGEDFPLWFAAMALLSASGTVINARLVMRVGMRRMAASAYAAQAVIATVMLLVIGLDLLPPPWDFVAFFAWTVSLVTMAGVTFGNLNGMALQHMGHIAGMTASLVSAVSTILAMIIAAPIGLLYNGTAVPVIAAAALCSALAWTLMRGLSPHAG